MAGVKRAACLGPAGSYSELAARTLCPHCAPLLQPLRKKSAQSTVASTNVFEPIAFTFFLISYPQYKKIETSEEVSICYPVCT